MIVDCRERKNLVDFPDTFIYGMTSDLDSYEYLARLAAGMTNILKPEACFEERAEAWGVFDRLCQHFCKKGAVLIDYFLIVKLVEEGDVIIIHLFVSVKNDAVCPCVVVNRCRTVFSRIFVCLPLCLVFERLLTGIQGYRSYNQYDSRKNRPLKRE